MLFGRIPRFLPLFLAASLVYGSCAWANPAAGAAVPGDIASVLQHCGDPSTDAVGYDPSTHRMQRVLRYNYAGLSLHFQPAGGSWSFTSGTLDGQLASLHRLENSSRCLRESFGSLSAPVVPAIVAPVAIAAPAATQQATLHLSSIQDSELLGLGILCLAIGMFLPLPRSFRGWKRRARSGTPLDPHRVIHGDASVPRGTPGTA